MAQVKYHLIAQLNVSGNFREELMVGALPELGVSKIRHELQIIVNPSEAAPVHGMPAGVVH